MPLAPRNRFIWLARNDLRVHDNPCLSKIAQRCGATANAEVLPLYLFDPRHFGTTARGSPKTGSYRTRFLLESVVDLRAQLRALGSDLLVGVGRPEDVLPTLVIPARDGEGAATGATTTILWQEQVTSEELEVDAAIRSALPAGAATVEPVWGGTLYEKKDLPFAADLADLPDVFTPFRNKAENKATVRAPLRAPAAASLPLPAAESLALPTGGRLGYDVLPEAAEVGLASPAAFGAAPDPRGVMPFPGGEAAALARLKHYLWDGDHLGTYFETRNGMLGADYSSKLAPWLAHGCISPRLIADECGRYERERVKNKSTYWLVFELIWRDFFKLYCAKHGTSVFKAGGPIGSAQRWRKDPTLLQRWKEGTTGVPLVDANMRELAATGFMSNRGRQNVASYLALDLQLDWRDGADHFESLLLDYDVCSNWGNWAAAAGVTGGRVNRFNLVKQSKDYDADGAYVRHWLPELANVPTEKVHEPWKMSKDEMERSGCRVGAYGDASCDYPTPPKSHFVYGEKGGGGGGGRGGGRGRGGGGRSVAATPAQAAIMNRGKGGGGRSGGRGGGRKRVQMDYMMD